MFFNAETRRYRRVEKDFERFARVIATKDVQKALGSRGLSLLALASDFYIPNFRHGIVTIPKEYEGTDAVPVLPVPRDKEIRVSSQLVSFTPDQRRVVTAKLASYGLEGSKNLVEDIERSLSSQGSVVTSLPFQAKVTAAGDSVSLLTETGDVSLQAFCRPVMLLDEGQRHPPSVIGHELVHVDQFTQGALIEDSPEVSLREHRELEAYEEGAVIERYEGWGHETQQQFERARRRLTDSEKPYEATQALRDFLSENGYKGWNE